MLDNPWLNNFGSVAYLFGFIAVLIIVEITFRRFLLRRTIRKVVKGANDGLKKAFNPDAENVRVELRSIPGLNYSFYEEVTADMETLGFHAGHDLENLDLTAINPWLRTGERTFFREGGEVVGNCFHLKTRGWRKILQLFSGGKVDVYSTVFTTMLKDGAVIGTARSSMEPVFSDPADLYGKCFPVTTPLRQLLDSHIQHVATVVDERGVPAIQPIRSEAGYRALHRYLCRKKIVHREELGTVTAEEFKTLTGNLDKNARRIIRQEAEKLEAKSAGQRQPSLQRTGA